MSDSDTITWSTDGQRVDVTLPARNYKIEWSPETLRSLNGYGPETTLDGKDWSVRPASESCLYRYPGMPPDLMAIEIADSFTPEQALKLADEIRAMARARLSSPDDDKEPK